MRVLVSAAVIAIAIGNAACAASTPPGCDPATSPSACNPPPAATPDAKAKPPAPTPTEDPSVFKPPPTGDTEIIETPPPNASRTPVIKPPVNPPPNPTPEPIKPREIGGPPN
jgi:hypothetical protein